MWQPYAPPGATSDDDDDIQFMVNVVPVDTKGLAYKVILMKWKYVVDYEPVNG